MSSSRHRLSRHRLGSVLRPAASSLVAVLAWVSASAADTSAGGAGELVDPTRPARFQRQSAAAPAAAQAALTLRAIVISEGRRVAVIDGRQVKPGDRIGGAEVVAIDPYQVRLKADGKPFTLRLVERPIEKRKAEPKASSEGVRDR